MKEHYQLRKRRKCHDGPVEVVKNLFCGSERESYGMVSHSGVDVLVPLNDMSADLWDMGFRGEVLYYPIKDYGTLPDDVLEGLVDKILERLNCGKKVGIFCMGGHGRTGYVAAVVLGRLGYDDPIEHLRTQYCEHAVESNEQIRHIARMLGKPEMVSRYETRYDLYDTIGFDRSKLYAQLIDESLLTDSLPKRCGDCDFFQNGLCEMCVDFLVDKFDLACDMFVGKDI